MVCFLPIFSYIKAESLILSLDGEIHVRENLYSRIFYFTHWNILITQESGKE